MKLPGILLLLSALTTTGYSITCKSCWHLSSVPCDGPSITCAPNQDCVAALTTVNIVGEVTPQYSITCGTTDQCNLTGSFTFIYGNLLTGTSCCSSNNCTPPYPILPSQSSQKNGRKCRTCTSDKSDYCYTSDELQCTGEETKCGRMARTLSGTINLKDAIRGCTTRSFCDILGSQTSLINGLNVDMKTYCSDGAAGLRVGYLFSIFTALMIKFIF